MPSAAPFRLRRNAHRGPLPRVPYLGVEAAGAALAEIACWPGYRPTPLRELPGLAETVRVRRVWYKDEGHRFDVGSFKPLGGGYAVARLIAREVERATGRDAVTSADLLRGEGRTVASGVTVACATDGNHGRAVAWSARMFGSRSVVYVASHVSPYREAAIAGFGAEVVRSAGNHDDAVREMAAAARDAGWRVVTQSASATDPQVPRDILSGYGALMAEVAPQLPPDEAPSHVFVPAGVGGLAASVAAFCADRWGPGGPRVVSVEAAAADSVFRSVGAGRMVRVTGALETVMGGLAAGEVSPVAWPSLYRGLDAAMAIRDAAAVDTLRLLRAPPGGDRPVAAGETGVAALAAALLAAGDDAARRALGMDGDSTVLAIGTEGVTDPSARDRLLEGAPEGA